MLKLKNNQSIVHSDGQMQYILHVDEILLRLATLLDILYAAVPMCKVLLI